MSDTPRTDAAWALCIELDARFPMHDLSTQLERELNAANERIKRLERDNKNLIRFVIGMSKSTG